MMNSSDRLPLTLLSLVALGPLAGAQLKSLPTEISCPVDQPSIHPSNPSGSNAEFNFLNYLWGQPLATSQAIPVPGQPATITWGLVLDGTTIPASPNFLPSPFPSNLRARVNAFYPGGMSGSGQQPGFIADVTGWMNEWAAVSGVTFTHETSTNGGVSNDDGFPMDGAGALGAAGFAGTRADIRIGGAHLTSPTEGFAYYPNSGGDIVLNTSLTQPGGGTALWTNRAFMRNLIRHEVGHSLGLGHVCPINATKVMEPIAQLTNVDLSLDDRLGVQTLYGDAFENDDTLGTANVISLSTTGTTSVTQTDRSINKVVLAGSTDDDLFSIVTSTPGIVTVTISPAAGSYCALPQPQQGSCTPVCECTTPLSATCYSNNWGDLTLTTVDSTGAVRLSNVGGPGFGEMHDIVFPAPGAASATVSVDTTSSALSWLQAYDITFSIAPLPTFPTGSICQDGAVLDASGALEDTIFINGSNGGTARRVDVPINTPLSLLVQRPSQNTTAPAGFVIAAIGGAPGPTPFSLGPIGTLCFDPFGASTLQVADTFGTLGRPNASAANPIYTLSIPGGFSGPGIVTVQGVIEETPGILKVTNAIILNVIN